MVVGTRQALLIPHCPDEVGIYKKTLEANGLNVAVLRNRLELHTSLIDAQKTNDSFAVVVLPFVEDHVALRRCVHLLPLIAERSAAIVVSVDGIGTCISHGSYEPARVIEFQYFFGIKRFSNCLSLALESKANAATS